MPRPLVFANGSLLVQVDERYDIRDLCYPLPGQWNHLAGAPIRMGVFCNGHFAWCADHSWKIESEYVNGGLVAETILTHEAMALEIQIRESVHPDQPWFLREIEVHHAGPGLADVRVFFAHDLRLEESDMGDTAMVIPHENALIHFKRQTYVLMGVEKMHEYATGVRGDGRGDGCWRDAEDGHLSNRAIDQGSVDSVFSVRLDLGPGEKRAFGNWILFENDLDGALKASSDIREQTVSTLLDQTQAHWNDWHARNNPTPKLDPKIEELYQVSLAVIASQCADNGAILAANDSSIMVTNRANYSYVWPRDAALVAMAMQDAGYPEFAERYFEYCRYLLTDEQPFFLQKYCPDGTVGATWHPRVFEGKPEVPLQQDETALTTLAFCKFCAARQGEPDADLYRKLVVNACNFLAKNVDDRGLPLPSYDLWEERRGIHAYTVITTIAALEAAAELAGLQGDGSIASPWVSAAPGMRKAADLHLTDAATGRWIRALLPSVDPTVDSACLAAINFGVDAPDSARSNATLAIIEEKLNIRNGITGIARYENDYYCRTSNDFTGNPWPVCTLWLAQAHARRAKNATEVEKAIQWLRWCVDRAEITGVLAEQFEPATGRPLSVSPLTWSHAEFVRTVALVRSILQKFS